MVVSELRVDVEFEVEEDIAVVVRTDDVDDFERIIVEVEGVTKSVVEEGVGTAENGLGRSESITPTGPSNSTSSDSGHDNSSG